MTNFAASQGRIVTVKPDVVVAALVSENFSNNLRKK